jgi:DNA polymerase III subunit epsilon
MDPVVIIPILIFAVIVLFVFLRVFAKGDPSRQDQTAGHLNLPSELSGAQSEPPPAAKSVDLSAYLPRQFVVLDLETTGLNCLRDEIIEIGAVRATLDSENHATFQTLVKPVRRIPRGITRITGITQEMVDRDGVPIRDALSQFLEFIGDLPLVTFNAEFDMRFLCEAAKREQIVIKNGYACALKRARRAWPGLESYKLADLARMGNLSRDNGHRALDDSVRALIVFTAATSKLGQKVRWTKPSPN